ncbi:hypothetical protein C6Y45_04290 [Alkalicoccus saliphilus]|uniref:Uncharacterized protein n=1 Tax=Alkalicoccus saliphilus TaxID=200989 RepID=A0A2T4U903_9BACI|nr:hypothetical protein C6Y45_04290 [Alkalicoccus saliphilus]
MLFLKIACGSLHLPRRKHAAVLPSGRICPGLGFKKKSSIYKKLLFSFFMKKRSGNRPVEKEIGG